VAVALFARTVGFGWVYDDQVEIVLNPLVRSFRNIPQLFSTTAWAGAGMETYLYRPLALLTYTLNHQISALDPWSYHLVNVLLHALASVLVFRVGKLWGLTTAAAGLGGVLFALHPVHVEVVAAAFGRKDLLAAVFTLGMVLLHPWARAGGWWRVALPVGAFGCALLSKEVGVVGILLVAAHDWFTARDRRELLGSSRLPGLYIAYLGIFLAYILVRNAVTGGMGIPDTFYLDNPLVTASPGARLLTAWAVVGQGVGLQFFPLVLSPDYSFNAIPLVESATDWRFLLPMAGLLLTLGVLREPKARSVAVVLALVWYMVTLFPTSNLLVTVGTIFGERLLYLPSVAFCLLAGLAMAWAIRRFGTPALIPLIGVFLALSAQTLRYSGSWKDDLSLFRWAVASVPESTKAHHKLGEELLRAGDPVAALGPLAESLRIAPDNEFAARTLDMARRRVVDRFLPGEGSVGFGEALPQDPEVYYALGQGSRALGDMIQAERFWREAVAMDPTHGESLADLAVLRLASGDTATALEFLRAAVSNRPGLASAWYNLARLHLSQGEEREAASALRSFLTWAGARYSDQVTWASRTLAGLDVSQEPG
jgi:Flp pilus assembly protein TadD